MYAISDATYRLYIDTRIEFFADIFYMSIDGAIVEIVVVSHDIFHKRFSFYHSLGVFYQVIKDSKFCLRHLDFFSWEISKIVFCIEGDVSECDHFFFFSVFFSFFCPLCHRSDTCYEFTRTKRLRYIVICSKFKKSNFIIFTSSCRKYDYRCTIRCTYFSAYLDAIFSRKIDIENDKMGIFFFVDFDRFKSIWTYNDSMSRLFEIHSKRSNDALIIFNKKEMHSDYRWMDCIHCIHSREKASLEQAWILIFRKWKYSTLHVHYGILGTDRVEKQHLFYTIFT